MPVRPFGHILTPYNKSSSKVKGQRKQQARSLARVTNDGIESERASRRCNIQYTADDDVFVSAVLYEGESDVCAICHDSHARYSRLLCNHVFGKECIDVWFATLTSNGAVYTTCPVCRCTLTST